MRSDDDGGSGTGSDDDGSGGSGQQPTPDPDDPVGLRERAVRMVLENERLCGSQWEAICSVAGKLGPAPETVRLWVRRAEIDGGVRPGVTTAGRARIKDLERENRELRWANEILKAALIHSGFCGYRAVTDDLRVLRPTSPALVVAGSGHVKEGGHLRNESLIWIARRSGNIPVGSPLAVRKMVSYDGKLGTERLTELGTEITVQVDGPWRAAFGICRDLLNSDTTAALSQIGVNLVAVPVCSPKTTNLSANAARLAADGPGIVLLANGPRRFRDAASGSDPDIPMSMIATPLDQILNPTHSAICSPPQLCAYEFETNKLATI